MISNLFVIFTILQNVVTHRRDDLRVINRIPKCIPVDHSDSRSSSSDDIHRRREREDHGHPRVEHHLQLVQGILIQVNLNIEKYARWFSEELRQKLIAGVSLINKNVLEKIHNDVRELEKKIIKIICQYNSEILRELIELVTNTNADLLDNIIQIKKHSFDTLNSGLTAAAVPSEEDPNTLMISADTHSEMVNDYIKRLIEEIERLFRRVTAAEKGLANKIIEDKLHNQLRDIEKLLCDFERKIENYFKELGLETASLVTMTINNSTRRFIGYIDELIKKVGVNIICILQGNRHGFDEPTIVNPSFYNKEKFIRD